MAFDPHPFCTIPGHGVRVGVASSSRLTHEPLRGQIIYEVQLPAEIKKLESVPTKYSSVQYPVLGTRPSEVERQMFVLAFGWSH